MKKTTLQLGLTAMLLFVVFAAFSQGGPPPPPAPLPQGNDIPFDGGIFLLLAAGLIYGSKKLYKSE